MTRFLAALVALVFAAAASAQQPVTVIGPVTPGNCPVFNSTTIVKDSGGPCGSGAGGTVTGPNPSTASGLPLWNNAIGTQLKDGAGQTVTGNYSWSGAQTFSNLVNVNAIDPAGTGDPNNRFVANIQTAYDQNIAVNPGFAAAYNLELVISATHGNYVYGNGTNSKTSFVALAMSGTFSAAGQRFLMSSFMNCYGIGDCGIYGAMNIVHTEAPVNGDEGVGWGLVQSLNQPSNTNIFTVVSTSRNTCNTTLTQNVTGSLSQQTVTIANGTGCTANTWVVLNHEQPTASPNHEAVQIVSSTSTSLTAVIAGNYSSGMTVTPAVDLQTSGGFYSHGEGRIIVDMTATPYTTGTVTSVSGGGFIGTATGWSNTMLSGGSVLNPGCISLTADDYSSAPFSPGLLTTLHDDYQILSVTDATHLAILSNSVAGDASYKGKGPGAGSYFVRPCAQILRVLNVSNEVILDTNGFAWTNGNQFDESIPPYPDVTGFQYHLSTYSNGGTNRSFLYVTNVGARKFQTGISIVNDRGPIAQGLPGADSNAWGQGLFVNGADIAIQTGVGVATAALGLSCGIQCGAASDGAGTIGWGTTPYGGYITPNHLTGGIDFRMVFTAAGPGGILSGIDSGSVGSGTAFELKYTGFMVMPPLAIGSSLPNCAAGLEGALASVNNSNTATWGAPAASGGSNHVMVRCNGTNWTVMGI